MQKEFKKTSVRSDPAEPSAGLFDRIILAIKREQELYQTKRLLLIFFCLLIVSFGAAPFSWTVFVDQAKASGILYFISVAIGNLRIFSVLERFQFGDIGIFADYGYNFLHDKRCPDGFCNKIIFTQEAYFNRLFKEQFYQL